MKKIIIINFLILIAGIFILFITLKIINLFVSGPARYHELVYNLEGGDLKTKKEKLVYYKSIQKNYEKDNFFKYSSNILQKDELKNIVNGRCGSLESGLHELYYLSDKKGFRENLETLYEKTDYVLVGDSFVMSVCENKPYDLKSQLQKMNKDNSYLNLGIHNVNYVKQLSVLTNVTKYTDFNNLIWFFYEGNDYNDDLINYNKYNSLENFNTSSSFEGNINYYINRKFKISNYYKLRVWLAEEINGLSSLLKYFKKYEGLLNNHEYDSAIKIAKNYLDNKNIKNKYIYYIPSWQRISNYKSKKVGLYKSNPQVKQLDQLKTSVKNISEKYGFKFIDGEEIFMNLNNPLSVFHYGLNTHFNRKGYELMALDINRKILDN